jgi:hypothetical protein
VANVVAKRFSVPPRKSTPLGGHVAAWLLYAFFASFALTSAALPAFADVLVLVDKSTQQMSVSVDGVPRYRFAVSTGRAGYGTPNGTYHPQRLETSWFSQLWVFVESSG